MNIKHVILYFLFLTCFSIGQTKIDSLVILGIQYHGDGEYDKAVKIYQSALEIEIAAYTQEIIPTLNSYNQ